MAPLGWSTWGTGDWDRALCSESSIGWFGRGKYDCYGVNLKACLAASLTRRRGYFIELPQWE